MIADKKVIAKNFLEAINLDCKFYHKGQELKLAAMPKMQITDVIKGDYSNNYNYKIKGNGDFSIKKEADGDDYYIWKGKYFCCMIKVKDEDVEEIKRIDISDTPC